MTHENRAKGPLDMKQTSTTPTQIETQAAERLIARAEGLTLGTSPPTFTREREAIEALLLQARQHVFPQTLGPVSIAALADFRFAIETSGPPFETRAVALVALHGAALDEYDELASIVRSPRAQKLVLRQGLADALGAPDSGTAALEAWMVTISAQIAARPDHPLAGPARVVSEITPSLRSRLDAVEQRHEAHAAEEAKRLAGEEQAREQVRADAERAKERRLWAANLGSESRENRDRREGLAEFYAKHASHSFRIGGRSLTGRTCADNLLAGAEIFHYFNGQHTGERPRRTA